MRVTHTDIKGVYLVEAARHVDDRGRVDVCFEQESFYSHELEADWNRALVVESCRRGVLRGLHYQATPHGETKLVKCLTGGIFDVVVDVRRESETYGRATYFYLRPENMVMLYVPEGVAHGYQSLEPSQVLYLIAGSYAPESARGIVWNDETLAIEWPIWKPLVSAADKNLPAFEP